MKRILSILPLVALLLVAGSARAGGGPASIQERIDRARPGDTLRIPPGEYAGNVLITKRLHLFGGGGGGSGQAVIRGEGRGSAVVILADSCTLDGFRIEHCGTMLVDEDAGILVKSNRNTITNNTLSDILFGIYFLHAEYNTTSGNRITGRKELGLGERGSGIHIWNSRCNMFTGNTITDARDGFYIQNANGMEIEHNTVSGVRYGLHYMYADSNTFIGNSFTDNVAGAAIMYSKDITMRHNVFAHNRGFSSFGILFQDCHHSVADSNVIADNVVGLFFEASTDNTFRQNLIARNDAALQMFQNSTGNLFCENNFVDNLNHLLIVGKQTGTRWSDGVHGNYWSSYDGYDLDDDGIGDVPMKIQNVFQYLEGAHEQVRLYLYSPASQALALATKAFPIIALNNENDDHPLMKPFPMAWAGHAGQGSTPGPQAASAGPDLLLVPATMLAGLLGLLVLRIFRKSHP